MMRTGLLSLALLLALLSAGGEGKSFLTPAAAGHPSYDPPSPQITLGEFGPIVVDGAGAGEVRTITYTSTLLSH
jgi:hypothetical protein